MIYSICVDKIRLCNNNIYVAILLLTHLTTKYDDCKQSTTQKEVIIRFNAIFNRITENGVIISFASSALLSQCQTVRL